MGSYVINRLKALIIDWLCVCGYLIVLAIVAFLVYLAVWQGIPEFTMLQNQMIVTFTTVVPVILWFARKESQISYSSFGKLECALQLSYRRDATISALVRNTLKFLPWQIAHMSVIHGVYSDFSSSVSMLGVLFSIFLALTYVAQVVITPSHRHLPDLIAGARVVSLPD